MPNSTEEEQYGMGKCGVLRFDGNNLSVRRLACRAISASAELLVHVSVLRCLFHRRTRACYVYNGCLAWYNAVLTPQVHSLTQA